MQIRNTVNRDISYNIKDENIYRLLELETYASKYKEIQESLGNEATIGGIIKTQSSRRGPRITKTLPYSTIVSRLPLAKRIKILNQTPGTTLAPYWMRQVTARFSETQDYSCDDSITLNTPELFIEPDNSLITVNNAKKVEMWTDGAYHPETSGMGAVAIFVDPENPNETIDWVKCKPGPNNPDALKAELIAIIFGLLHIARDVIVVICTDSLKAINGTKLFKLGIQNRNALKENHHDLLTLLSNIISKNFDVEPTFRKVESKVNELNIMADAAAKEIRDDAQFPLFDISPMIMSRFDPDADLFLYHNETRIVQYPTKYLRQLHDDINLKFISEYIKIKNSDIHTREVILTKQTIQAAVELIDDEQKRDRGNFKIASWNINSWSHKLETMDKLYRYQFILNKSTLCPRCGLEEETNEHILKCTDTLDRFPAILEAATITLQRELDRVWSVNKAVQTRYTKPTPEVIWAALEATESSVLDKPIAKGIITQALVDSFKSKVLVETQTLTRNARNPQFITEDTIGLATAALTTALYHEIWKPRTKYIFSENSKLQYELKQREWRQKRDKKQEKKDQSKKDRQEKRKPPKPVPKSKKKRENAGDAQSGTTPIVKQRLNLKRDIKKTKKSNPRKRKEHNKSTEEPKAKKSKTQLPDLPYQPKPIGIYSEKPRPKRKVPEGQDVATPPKKKRKETTSKLKL
jgi:hypothetical protein